MLVTTSFVERFVRCQCRPVSSDRYTPRSAPQHPSADTHTTRGARGSSATVGTAFPIPGTACHDLAPSVVRYRGDVESVPYALPAPHRIFGCFGSIASEHEPTCWAAFVVVQCSPPSTLL